MGSFAQMFVEFFALALSLLILGRVLMSRVDTTRRTRLPTLLYAATEPILAPIGRARPQTGMLDLSPMVVLIVLGVVLRAVR